jgi:hypothetical protein
MVAGRPGWIKVTYKERVPDGPVLKPSRMKALHGTIREDMQHDRTRRSSMSYSDSIRISIQDR